jgi:hypothetical protein
MTIDISEVGNLARARIGARERLRNLELSAEQLTVTARNAVRRAERAANFCDRAIEEFERDHRHRLDEAHDGIDQLVASAPDRLVRELRDNWQSLCGRPARRG